MDRNILSFVREHNYLYDKSCNNAKYGVLRRQKWNELAEELDEPVDLVKKRWRTMRDRYLRLVKTGEEQKYKYYDDIKFLGKGKAQRRNPLRYYFPESFDDELDSSQYALEIEPNTEKSIFETKYLVDNNKTYINEYKVPKKKTWKVDFRERQQYLKNRGRPTFNNNAIGHFMHSLTLQLESANLSATKLLRLQLKILQVVSEELKKNTI